MTIYDLTLSDLNKYSVYKYLDEDSDEIVPDPETGGMLREGSGFFLIVGEVILVDGTKYPAIFGISTDDGGEMFEYYFLAHGGEWISDKDDLPAMLNKSKDEIFPFKYHLNVKVENDLNVDFQY